LDGLKDIEEAMLEKLAAVLKIAQDRYTCSKFSP
jgi:hypothetical protein